MSGRHWRKSHPDDTQQVWGKADLALLIKPRFLYPLHDRLTTFFQVSKVLRELLSRTWQSNTPYPSTRIGTVVRSRFEAVAYAAHEGHGPVAPLVSHCVLLD